MNILFDLDDTLYDIEPIFEEAINELFPNFKYKNINDVYLNFRKHSDELFSFSKKSEDNLKKMQILRIQRTLFEYDYFITIIDASEFHKVYEEKQYNVQLKKDVESTLINLKNEGYNLGLITNGDSYRQRKKIKSLNLKKFFGNNIFVSGDYSFSKPDIRIFDLVSKVFDKENFIYVGDSFENDVLGSYQAGWLPVWYNKKNNLPSKVVSHVEITKINELPNIIEEISSVNQEKKK